MEENMQYDDLGTLAQLNWFPGHMAKAKRIIVENLKLVDVVIELRDARIPNSSANPILKDLIGKKPHLIALNKIDLADNNINIYAKSKFFYFTPIAFILSGSTPIVFSMPS